MSSTHTIYPGYSGPFLIDFDEIRDVAVDVFGRSEVVLVDGTPLYPGGMIQEPVDVEIELVAGADPVVVNLPAGHYRGTYLSGAYQARAGGPWNEGYLGDFAGNDPALAPTLRPWGFVGSEPEFYWPFNFELGGFPDAATAEAAAMGTTFDFWHEGGSFTALWDNDPIHGNTPAGSVTFRIQQILEPSGRGFWDVSWSSLPNDEDWPVVNDPLARYPTISNVSPGLHLIRFNHIDADGNVRWQNFYIWSWRTPPRENPLVGEFLRFDEFERDKFRRDRFSTLEAQVPAPWELFPVRPPKELGGVFPYDTYIRQPPPTSGNHPERPDRVADLPKERGREGAAEDY